MLLSLPSWWKKAGVSRNWEQEIKAKGRFYSFLLIIISSDDRSRCKHSCHKHSDNNDQFKLVFPLVLTGSVPRAGGPSRHPVTPSCCFCLDEIWMRYVRVGVQTVIDLLCRASLWYGPPKCRNAPSTRWWASLGSRRPQCRCFSSTSPDQMPWQATAALDTGQHTTLTDGLIPAPQAPHIKMLFSLMCKAEIINSSIRFRSYLENEKQPDKSSEPEPLCLPDSPDYPSQLCLMFKALKTSDYAKRRGITHPILAGI